MSHLVAFQDGLLAAKAGKKMIARLQFEQVTELNPDFLPGWLWLAWTADSPEQAEVFLAKAHVLDPTNRLVSNYREIVAAMGGYEVDKDYSNFLATAEPDNVVPSTVKAEQSEEPTNDNESIPEDSAGTQPLEEIAGAEKTGATDTRSFQDIQREITDEAKKTDTATDSQQTEAFEIPDDEPTEPIVEPTGHSATAIEITSESELATAFDSETEALEDSREEGKEEEDATPVEPVAVLGSRASEEEEEEEEEEDATEQTRPSVTLNEKTDDHIDLSANDESQLAAEFSELKEEVETAIADSSSESNSNNTTDSHTDATEDDVPIILAVDDSPTVRKLVTMTLQSGGYKVETAEDGVEAMKMLAKMTPSLILLDVNMPRMDGYKLCKLIKRHEKTKFIPVVMLSGKDGMFDKLRGTLVGCDDYISKPFRSKDLLNHIEKYVLAPSL